MDNVEVKHNNLRPENGWSVYLNNKLQAIYFSESEALTAKAILEKGWDLDKMVICKR